MRTCQPGAAVPETVTVDPGAKDRFAGEVTLAVGAALSKQIVSAVVGEVSPDPERT